MADHDPRLLTCREADRIYRLRHGTAAAATRSKTGGVRFRVRGRAILISAKDAQVMWGIPDDVSIAQPCR